MSDYARFSLNVDVSERDDYAKPYIDYTFLDSLTPDETLFQKVEADTTGTTVSISQFATVTSLIVENLDSANSVEVSWRENIGSQTSTNWAFADVAAGDTIDDNDALGTMVTNGAKVGRWARITGTTGGGGNDVTSIIQAVNANGNDITLGGTNSGNIGSQDPEEGTIYFDEDNAVLVPFGRFVVIPSTILTTTNLTLTAKTAAVTCRVVMTGT